MSKNVCPMVAKFLVVMYTNQTFRVLWCSNVSQISTVSNGVKQGGVMSPLLFTMYMDELLHRLKLSNAGCYVGNVYCGSLGYADDVVLMAPTVNSLNTLLDICTTYAVEYDVLFNPDKSKFIFCCGSVVTSKPIISFMGKPIESVPWDKHLGYPVGNITDRQLMNNVISNFMSKVNMVRSHFKHVPYDIMYSMFKSYCMPLYGCPLWDYCSPQINMFYVAWRKSVRYILNLPYTTHCDMLHRICDDNPIHEQLYSRFCKFFCTVVSSDNVITRTCSQLAMNGSGSNVSNNISLICQYQCINRFDISPDFIGKNTGTDGTIATSQVVADLLQLRYNASFQQRVDGLTPAECNIIINSVCTE